MTSAELQQMLDETLAKLANTQGRLQACEEIISRTRQAVQGLRSTREINHVSWSRFLEALGPVQ